MSPRKLVSIIAVAVAIMVAGGAYYAWSRSPQFAMKRAAQAASEHDLATFQRYVDTERLAARFMDDMLASATDEVKKDEFGGLAAGMFMMMRPQQ